MLFVGFCFGFLVVLVCSLCAIESPIASVGAAKTREAGGERQLCKTYIPRALVLDNQVVLHQIIVHPVQQTLPKKTKQKTTRTSTEVSARELITRVNGLE